jgi:4-amino-4-deoxy-L-arabinose transferase-like glycosyltransferase
LSRERASGPRLADLLAWAAVLAVASAALALTQYRARDPDSVLYARISADLSRRPVDRWIAPEWPSGWYEHGLYREHPVGTFLVPAAAARLGFPEEQAAYAVNAFYQAMALVLVPWLAAALVKGHEARALAWILQLLPIAFTYRIRANQEAALLVCLVGALLGTELSRRRAAWGLLTTASLVWFLLVKGVLSLVGPAACTLWLLVRRRASPRPRPGDGRAWAGLALAVAAMALVAVGYELAYRRATGESFWLVYAGRQLGLAARPQPGGLLVQKAYNLVWYLGRVLWFPFPFTLALLVAALSRRADSLPPEPKARGGLQFALALAGLYLVLFSLSDRRADRYLFPAYYALGAAGALVALERWAWLRRLAQRVDRFPAAPAALFLILFALHVTAGRLGLPTVKVWVPD